VDTVNGDFDGTLKYYYSNGHIKSVQHWQNGFPDGDFIFYDELGDVIRHEIYNFKEKTQKL